MIHRVYLEVVLPSVDPTGGNFNWVDNIGHVLIDEVSIEIGGQVINYKVTKNNSIRIVSEGIIPLRHC